MVYQAHFRKYAAIKGPGCMRSSHKYQKIIPSRVAAIGPADRVPHFIQVCYFCKPDVLLVERDEKVSLSRPGALFLKPISAHRFVKYSIFLCKSGELQEKPAGYQIHLKDCGPVNKDSHRTCKT